ARRAGAAGRRADGPLGDRLCRGLQLRARNRHPAGSAGLLGGRRGFGLGFRGRTPRLARGLSGRGTLSQALGGGGCLHASNLSLQHRPGVWSIVHPPPGVAREPGVGGALGGRTRVGL
ncbi:MAG: hypothetical protein AVDCRST_MAG08-1617, partial [uncultured Acetobacteraceae bacterium]